MNKEFIFIPFCMICPAFQAKRSNHFARPIIEELFKHNINIIQMPCPESLFGGYENGLRRIPKGISKYDIPSFRKLCDKLSLEIVNMVKGILSRGDKVIAFLGIEYSPSCATKYQYTNKGTIYQQGLFIEAIKNRLDNEDIKIPFVGITKRWAKKSLERLQNFL